MRTLSYRDVLDAAQVAPQEVTEVSIKLALARFSEDESLFLLSTHTGAGYTDFRSALRQRGHGYIRLNIFWQEEFAPEVRQQWLLVSVAPEQLGRLPVRCISVTTRDVETVLAAIGSTGRPGTKLGRVTYPAQSFTDATIVQARRP